VTQTLPDEWGHVFHPSAIAVEIEDAVAARAPEVQQSRFFVTGEGELAA
jgi:hypothetical protein